MGQDVSVVQCADLLHRLNVKEPFKCLTVGTDGVQNKSLHKFSSVVTDKWLHEAICCKHRPPPDNASASFEERLEILQPTSFGQNQHGLTKVDLTIINKPFARVRLEDDLLKDISSFGLNAGMACLEKQARSNEKQAFLKKMGITNDQCQSHVYMDDAFFSRILRELFQVRVSKLENNNAFDDTTPFTIFPNTPGDQCRVSHIWSCSLGNVHLTPVLGVLDVDDFYVIVEPSMRFTLHDVVSFSPAILSSSNTIMRFVIYQMLHILSLFRAKGTALDDGVTLRSINTLDSLWLFLSIACCHRKTAETIPFHPTAKLNVHTNNHEAMSLTSSYITCNATLAEYTEEWVYGRLNNFDYIMLLNHTAGRRSGDPHHHPIMPWVSDLTSPDGTYRDLKQSKFRLNKGDSQLDVTYNVVGDGYPYSSAPTGVPVPHHLSDLLSDVTYYIYTARRTPKPLLQAHVRQKWVPGEYPTSMERIYEWTPEECIPEFYYDETLFLSRHEDLPDLKAPSWCSDVMAFLDWHKRTLESDAVSTQLHHWIDLNFGFLLSGSDAITSRNVHLSLHDKHENAINCGVLQLFNAPHPQRHSAVKTKQIHSVPEEAGLLSSEQEFVPLTPTTKVTYDDCAMETSSLNGPDVLQMEEFNFQVESATDEALLAEQEDVSNADSPASKKSDIDAVRTSFPLAAKQANEQIENTVAEQKQSRAGSLSLPAHVMNFIDDLERVEQLLTFQANLNEPSNGWCISRKFGSVFAEKNDNPEQVTSSADRDASGIRLLVCWIVELIVPQTSSVTLESLPLDERLASAVKIMSVNRQRFPKWLMSVVDDLLLITEQSHLLGDGNSISWSSSLAPPVDHISSSMLLSPHFNLFGFPAYFSSLHNVLCRLYANEGSYSGDCVTKVCSFREDDLHPTDSSLVAISRHIQALITQDLDGEGALLLLNFINPLLNHSQTKYEAYLHLLQPISHALGPVDAGRRFLKQLQSLYDDLEVNNHVHCQFFGQQFISKVMNAFGLQVFLNHFVTFLIESLLRGSEVDRMTGNQMLSGRERLETFAEDIPARVTAPRMIQEECWSIEESDVVPKIDDEIRPDAEGSLDGDRVPVTYPIDDHEATAEDKSSSDELGTSLEHDVADFPAPASTSIVTEDKDSFAVVVLATQSLEESQTEIAAAFNVIQSEGTSDYSDEAADNGVKRMLSMSDAGSEKSVSAQEVTVATVKWLIPWLGPSLTSRYLVAVLIKKLPRLFTTQAVSCWYATDDLPSLSLVLQCFREVATIYGEAVVLHQYFPFVIRETETSPQASATVSLRCEGGLLAATSLLLLSISLLRPTTLMQHMESLCSQYFQPLIRQLATLKPFASGAMSRGALAYGLIDVLAAVCGKLDRDVAQELLSPVLQQFFSCFDGIYHLKRSHSGSSVIARKYSVLSTTHSLASDQASLTGSLGTQSEVSMSFLPNSLPESTRVPMDVPLTQDTAMLELYDVFSTELAYQSYVMFCRTLGSQYVENTLYNNDLIWQLCANHDDGLTLASNIETYFPDRSGSEANTDEEVVQDTGNNARDAFDPDPGPYLKSRSSAQEAWDRLASSCQKQDSVEGGSSWQHLEGSWIEHWKDSIGLMDTK